METICAICSRNTKLHKYCFGEPKFITNTRGSISIDRNPRYEEIMVCGTDRNLLIRIKKTNPLELPSVIIDMAEKFRAMKPIGDTPYEPAETIAERIEREDREREESAVIKAFKGWNIGDNE